MEKLYHYCLLAEDTRGETMLMLVVARVTWRTCCVWIFVRKEPMTTLAHSDSSRVLAAGVAKDDVDLDHWLKDLAPSSELRKWFGHDPDKWSEFRKRYLEELRKENAAEGLE